MIMEQENEVSNRKAGSAGEHQECRCEKEHNIHINQSSMNPAHTPKYQEELPHA